MRKLLALISKNAYIIAFALAAAAMAGSLYYSEILKLAPCVLCWYQRITMYPIVLLAAVAIWTDDNKAYRYILPLATIGLVVSIYHNLLYYGFIPESIQPCTFGVACNTRYESWLGFITIPLQSFFVYASLVGVMLIKRAEGKTKPA